jgi:ADP-ribosylglycohydrolase
MPTLYEKVYGCLAASRVASAMGAAVEGWSADRIVETYGFVDRFLPYKHYTYRGVDWERMPGTTEDGIERQKLFCRAIIAKQDRITAEDVAKVMAEVVDPDKMWYMSEPDDIKLVKFVKVGVPAVELGTLSAWFGLNAMARASHPIGLINACDPEGAVRDAADVGRLLFRPSDIALRWAGVYDAAIATALMPNATVESVISTAVSFATDPMKREIDRALDIVGRLSDYNAVRAEFYKFYNGFGTPYAMSSAAETVSKALALFVLAKGDAKTGILYGVNFGRDTDCMAAMAGGLSGALSGIGAVPNEWVEQVDKATMANPYTNTQCTIKEHADGVYGAIVSRARKMRQLASMLPE